VGLSTISMSRGRRRARFSATKHAAKIGIIVALALSATLVVSGTVQAASGGKSTFVAPNIPEPIPDRIDGGATADSTIAVSGITDTITKVELEMYVTGSDADLDAALLGPTYPSGPFAYLFTQNDLSGSNLGTDCPSEDQTRFDDSAASSITSSSAPYVGTWQVSGDTPGGPVPLSSFNGMSSTDANGNWTLDFVNSGTDALTIQCWSLYITTVADGRVEFDQFDSVSTPAAGDGVIDNTINVSGVHGTLSKVTVGLFITHPNDADLKVKLISPTGYEVVLAQNTGGSGNNFGNGCSPGTRTTFDSTSSNSLTYHNAPFAGTFRPQGGTLTTLNGLSGSDVNGTWTLEVTDTVAGNVGSLNCWSLNLWSTALDVQPDMAPAPLPDTWSVAGFTVTNTTNDPIDDVTLTATLPKTLAIVQAIPDTFPDCSLVGRKLTCSFAEIDAHSSAQGGVWAKVKHKLPSGRVCLTGTVSAAASAPVSTTLCIAQRKYQKPDQGNGYAIGKIAHNLVLKDQNGNTVSLYQFRGDYVLLQISARWCPPSQQEVPRDRDEVQALNDSNTMGVPVVYLQVLLDGATEGVQSTQADASYWASHFSLTTPVLYTSVIDAKHIASSMDAAYAMIAGETGAVVPVSAFIRPDGTIFNLRAGPGPDGDTTARFEADLP